MGFVWCHPSCSVLGGVIRLVVVVHLVIIHLVVVRAVGLFVVILLHGFLLAGMFLVVVLWRWLVVHFGVAVLLLFVFLWGPPSSLVSCWRARGTGIGGRCAWKWTVKKSKL